MERIVFENRCDEPFRTFKDECCGTIRTTDGGGNKCVMEVKRLGNLYGEDRGTGFAGNVWDKNGISPSLTTMQGGGTQQIKVLTREEPQVKIIGQMDNTMDHTFESANRVYDSDGLAPTVNTCSGGGLQPKVIVAMRGRNPQNPSDRTTGNPTEQRLEPNSQGIYNTLTSVQKDNLVLEEQVLTPKRTEYGKTIRKAYESGEIQESRHNMTELEPRTDGVTNTLTTVQKDNMVLIKQAKKDGYIECKHANSHIQQKYRIRKLTPRECGRLMGVSDEDISKMEKVNSNSQLYKQFGNSIVVDVMVAMFKNLF